MIELLDCVCSTEHLNKIAATFNYDWRAVGRRLVEARDVEDVDREGHSEQEKRDKIFEVWMKRKGSEATYRKLMNSFKEVHNQLAADMVKELLLTIAKGRHTGNFTNCNALGTALSHIEVPFPIFILLYDTYKMAQYDISNKVRTLLYAHCV